MGSIDILDDARSVADSSTRQALWDALAAYETALHRWREAAQRPVAGDAPRELASAEARRAWSELRACWRLHFGPPQTEAPGTRDRGVGRGTAA